MIRGIHHIAVHVHDIDRMIAFYRDAFGFEAMAEPFAFEKYEALDRVMDTPGSAARIALLKAGNCYIEMFQFSAPAGGETAPRRPIDKGYTHFCIDVTDIAAEYTRLKALGMTFGADAPVDTGYVIAVYGRDPEGNIIEIQETPGDSAMELP